MAKLSSREKAAKKLGVATNYKVSASKQGGISSSTKAKSSKKSSKGVKKESGKSTESQYSALMKKYEKTLTPSQEETAATKQLGDITTSAELGAAKAGQEVMPMNVITGSQANIQEQASLKSAPLSRLIAAEQAKRGAASDVLSAQSGLLKEKMALEQAASQAKFEAEQRAAESAQKQRDTLAQIAARKSGGKTGSTKLQSVSKKVGRTTIFGTYNPSTGQYSWEQ